MTVRCTDVIRDKNNRVMGYILTDTKNQNRYIAKNELKSLIKAGKVQISNLTLTGDGRLIKKKLSDKGKSLREKIEYSKNKMFYYEGVYYYLIHDQIVAEIRDKERKAVKILKGTTTINKCLSWSLETVEIPDSVIRISAGAFAGCCTLKEIVIPDNVVYTDCYVFENCTSLSKVALSRTLECIDCGMFYNCTNLKEMAIPNGVKTIENSAFYGCTSLVHILLPLSLVCIEGAAFRNCRSLSSINIPDGVTTIEHYAFKGCNMLKSVQIPKSTAEIGREAFYYCPNLKRVVLPFKFKEDIHDIFNTEGIEFKFI